MTPATLLRTSRRTPAARRVGIFLCVAAVGAFASCDNGPTGPRPPAQVSVESGGDQSGPAGAALPAPVVVRVLDARGRAASGIETRFLVVSGGGSVTPAVDTTDAEGRASTTWTLGSVAADSQRLEVQVINRLTGAVAATVRVQATASTGPAASLAAVGPTTRTGAPGAAVDSLRVRVADALGNPVAGVAVAWSLGPEAGSLSAPSTPTRSDGTAAVSWTLGPSQGTFAVTASVPGLQPVTFTAASTNPAFTIQVTSPASGSTVSADSVRVAASATSTTGGIVRMTARVENRVVELASGNGWVPLAGLVPGEKSLVVTAYSTTGDSASRVVPFVYNAPPQLQAATPSPYTVLRDGTVRVDATCTDTGPCTVSVYLTASDPAGPPVGTPTAQGVGAVNADVPVTAFEGTGFWLSIVARDEANAFSWVKIPLFAESTPRWTEVASAGIRVLDVDATRVLYVDSAAGEPARVRVRPRAGGTGSEVLVLPAGTGIVRARLFPEGAIFSTVDAVYEWRGGTTTQLALTPSLGYYLVVEGDWAVWHVETTLYRRELAAGVTNVVSTQSTNNGADVAENGDVVYRASNADLIWVRAGVPEVIAQGTVFGVTDGTQVVYVKNESTYLYRDGTHTLLSSFGGTPHEDYEANDGWAAFSRIDAGGVLHVWTVAPDGTIRQASSGARSFIAALGPQGRLVFTRTTTPRRRALAVPPGYEPVDVGGAIGEVRYQDGAFHVFVGRSAFRIDP